MVIHGYAENDDYIPHSAILTFAPGETEVTVAFLIAEDDVSELTEFFTVVLSNPSAGAELGTDSVATVTIVGTDGKYVQD